jgi:uncharacterized membrane protein YdbT with pleckstrin-like domain
MARVNLKPEGDERFVYIAHRHWTALVIRELIPVTVGAVTLLIFVSRALFREPDFLGRQPPLFDVLNIVLGISIIVTIAIAVYTWFDWSNDHLIVSNKRVVHEDRTLWLAFQYETIPIDRVQNVNIRTDNIFQYVLNYGRVEVQAAGPSEPIVFLRSNCPGELQKQLLNEVQRQKRSQEQKRLMATVDRRLNPAAPSVPPLHTSIEDEMQPANGPLQALFPIVPTLENGVITWHRHWVVLLKHLLYPTAALALWLLLLFVIPRFDLLSPTSTIITLLVLLIFVLLYYFWQYENWRNDIYILEPTKIIDIQRLPFGLYEDRREATLSMIQNVNANSPNIIARIFGYGDVLIETAGATGNFTFDHVPDPDGVQRVVFEYQERYKWQVREREWGNTLNIIDMYYQANNRGNNPPS